MRISAALIVRNEEACLGRCLESLGTVVDEIVVVDTGSVDRTVAIAEAAGARVFHYPWGGDFSAARNESLLHSTGDYILVLDADDTVENPEKARGMLLEFAGRYPTSVLGSVEIHSRVYKDGMAQDELLIMPRFFKRGEFHFEGAIHEQLTQAGGPATVAPTGISYMHSGYQDEKTLRCKIERNRRILIGELDKNPDDHYYLYQLGKADSGMGDHWAACKCFEKALDQIRFVKGEPPRIRTGGLVDGRMLADLLCRLAYAYVNTDRSEKALDLLVRHNELGHGATDWADFHYALGYVHLVLGHVAQSRQAFEAALARGRARELVRGTGGQGSYYHLGLLWEADRDIGRALACYLQSLTLDPGYDVALSRCVDIVVEYRCGLPLELWDICDRETLKRLYVERLVSLVFAGQMDGARLLLAGAKALADELAEACADKLREIQQQTAGGGGEHGPSGEEPGEVGGKDDAS